MFVTIANKQVNANAILGVDGALPKQKGKVKLYLDPRIAPLLSGLPDTHYVASSASDQPAIIDLIGEAADAFRQQWQQAFQSTGGSMSASG
jgi:hypothetical protein